MIIAEEQRIYLDKIHYEPLKSMITKSLEMSGKESKLKKANKVADIVWQKFASSGYIVEGQPHQMFVDITIAAALIYNLYYNNDDISTLFKYRAKLEELANSEGLDKQISNMMFELIEAQLGENHPIQKVKPAPNSPSSVLADAIWFVEKYKPTVK